jgi:hypothetical protein
MSVRQLAGLAVIALALLPALSAAADAADPVVVELKNFSFKVPADKASLFGHNTDEEKLFFYTNGKAEAKFKVPRAGDYEVVVKASCDLALKVGAKFKLAVADKQLGKETETTDEQKEYRFPIALKAGDHKLAIEFTNDVFKEGEYDRNLFVHSVVLKKAKKP